MANAVTWKNIGTVSGAGALAAANSSRQDIGQGIANIGKAASGFGDDQIQAETDLAVNALRAAAPDDRQGLLQSFADSNISMHSDQIGKVASEIDARDFAEDKFRTTTDATGAQRNIQNELDLSKFEYKKEQDAFSKALSVKKYNQKANEFNRSYDVANGLSRPMPMWDGSTSVNPIEQAQIDNVAINQTKSNPQFEGDTKDLDSSGPILVSRKDATVLAIQDLKLNGSTGGFKSNRDEVESKSGDILISSAVDAFSPVIEKSINDFMATNLEFFDEDGKIDYSAFQDQDQKIAPGAVKAGKMLDGRLSTMTKQMNKYLRNFPAGPKRDAREKQFREESGLNKLDSMSKEFNSKVSEQQKFERTQKGKSVVKGDKVRSYYDTTSSVSKVYNENYKDSDYDISNFKNQIATMRNVVPPAYDSLPDGLIAEAISNVTKAGSTIGFDTNNIELINNPSATAKQINVAVYEEIRNIVSRKNGSTNNTFMPAVANLSREDVAKETAELRATRAPESTLVKAATLAGKVGRVAKTASMFTPLGAGLLGKTLFDKSKNLTRSLDTKEERDVLLKALKGDK